MIAKHANLLTLLEGQKQFQVPLYQRAYSWQKAQCEQYWKDLLAVGQAEEEKMHFLGALVYYAPTATVGGVAGVHVIDGQQRLTTTMLLLLALANHLGESDSIVLENRRGKGKTTTEFINADRVRCSYFLNSNHNGDKDLLCKIMLTEKDRLTLCQLLQDRPLPEKPSQRILENLDFFKTKLNSGGIALDHIYRGLQRLMVVEVMLEHGDNPQRVFESMNSTGLALTQSDLIRNFMLMGLDVEEQNDVYVDCWKPMEKRLVDLQSDKDFKLKNKSKVFDFFVRAFLSIRTGREPVPVNTVYQHFKRHALEHGDPAALMEDMSRMSRYYATMLAPQHYESDVQVRSALVRFNRLKRETASPLILKAIEDWKEERIGKGEFLEFLSLTESYLFRSAVASIDAKAANKKLPSLASQLDQERYIESYRESLKALRGDLRFVGDEEFREAFLDRKFYEGQAAELGRYALECLEWHMREKELVDFNGLQIEHILPKTENLRAEWLEMLGPKAAEIQARYVHTIGNLTLTGYNPEMGKKPFLEKRDMPTGYRNSRLRLNADLAALDEWNEAQIVARAQRLAERALKVWPGLGVEGPASKSRENSGEKKVARAKVEAKAPSSSRDDNLENSLAKATPELRALFEKLQAELLEIGSEVTAQANKHYISYKKGKRVFCTLGLTKQAVRAYLNMPFDLATQQKEHVRDVTNVNKVGVGNVEANLYTEEDLGWFLHLANEALQLILQRDEN